MIDETLNGLDRLDKEATQGEWELNERLQRNSGSTFLEVVAKKTSFWICRVLSFDDDPGEYAGNARLIVALRNAYPTLRDEIRRLQIPTVRHSDEKWRQIEASLRAQVAELSGILVGTNSALRDAERDRDEAIRQIAELRSVLDLAGCAATGKETPVTAGCRKCGHALHVGRCGAEMEEDCDGCFPSTTGSHCHCTGCARV